MLLLYFNVQKKQMFTRILTLYKSIYDLVKWLKGYKLLKNRTLDNNKNETSK